MREKSSEIIDTPSKNSGSLVIGRRRALQLLGRVGVLCGLASGVACHSNSHDGASSIAASRVLSDSDYRLLSRLTELIIPKTDTAGAIQAGVPEFIDRTLAMSGSSTDPGGSGVYSGNSLSILFAEGFKWMEGQAKTVHGRGFLELEQKQQFALLESAYLVMEGGDSSSRTAQFLRMLKNLTVEGYFTSKEGLLDELGYKGNVPHDMAADERRNSVPCLRPTF